VSTRQNASLADAVTSGQKAVASELSRGCFDTLVSEVEDYAIFLLSPEGNVVSWNAGAQRIKGYTPEEIIGKHFSVFYTQEGVERCRPGHILRAAATQGRATDEG